MRDVSLIERTSTGRALIPLPSVLLEKRIIVVNDEINKESANHVIEQLITLSLSDEPVTMLIGSSGGSIQDGLSIIDVMEACPFEIRTVSLGTAASMAAILLSAGTKGKRYVTKHSRVMIHEPLILGGVGGSVSEIEALSKNMKNTKKIVNELLSEYTGKTIEEINEATSFDNFMTSEEAKEFGLVDEVVSGKELQKLLKGCD